MKETLWWFEYEREVTADHTLVDKYHARAVHNYWSASHKLFHGCELMFLLLTMLMMIERLKSHSGGAPQAAEAAPSAAPAPRPSSVGSNIIFSHFAMRGTMAIVILLGIGSLVSSAVGAAYTVRTGDLCALAAQVWDSTKEGAMRAADLDRAAHVEYETAYKAASVQNIFESAGCLLVAAAFLYLVPASLALLRKAHRTLQGKLRLIRSVDQATELAPAAQRIQDLSDFSSPEAMARHMVARAMKKTRVQRQRLIITNSIVLVAFIPRCIFVVFVAVSNFNNRVDESCGLCGQCQTIGRHLAEFLYVRPEFYSGVAWLACGSW